MTDSSARKNVVPYPIREESLEYLADNLSNAMVYQLLSAADGSRQFAYVSRGVERLHEVTAEEALADASTIYRQVIPEHLERLRKLEVDAEQNLSQFHIEIQYLLPSGALRWYEITATPRALSDGRLIWDGVEVDITERKQAETNLLLANERLEIAQHAAGAGTWSIDLIRQQHMWSDKMYEIFGLPKMAEPPSASLWKSLIHIEDLERTVAQVERAIAERAYIDVEYRIIRNGEIRWINSIGKASYDKEGRPLRVTGLCLDTTERKRAEEERRRLEIQVQQAHKLESLGVLAGGIAHDFNNLLLGLFGYIDRARNAFLKGANDKGCSALKQAGEFLDRARDLTGQLLTFAKGGAPVKKVMLIGAMLKKASAFALSGSNVKGIVRIPDDLWPCEADENQFSQVIDNILRNARDAMPSGGEISISAENMVVDSASVSPVAPGKYIRVSIMDKGYGIPAEHLPKIFDPFFSTKEKGYGLGLSTAYSIIKRHDGHIEVESSVGKGTTFHIYLPASEQQLLASAETKPRVYQGIGKILVMDDEPGILGLATAMLEDLGYSAEGAQNGEEAIFLYQKAIEKGFPFKAVILDLTIRGGMGGRETLTQLLKIDPNVKALVSSGYAHDAEITNPQTYGFLGAIPKPYRHDEFAAALNKVLGA